MVATEPTPEGPALLTRYLQEYGLTARDLADRLQPRVPRYTVARWARGDRRPAAAYQRQLARLAGIPEPAWSTTEERERRRRREAWLAEHPVRAKKGA